MRKLLLILTSFLSLNTALGQGYNGLIGRWNFDGNANDVSGNGLHGIPHNMTPATGINGVQGSAYRFNGSSSYIEIPYSPLMNTMPHSFCAVIKPTGFYSGNSQGNAIIWRGAQFGGNFSYHLEMFDNAYDNSDGVFSPTHEVFAGWTGNQTNGTPQQDWYYTPTIDSSVWYSVVLTYDGANTNIYIGGELVTNFPLTCNFNNTTNSLYFGKSQENQSHPFWLNAVVDEIRFYNYALTPTEVIQFGDSFGTGKIMPLKLFMDANGDCTKQTTEKLNTEPVSLGVDSNGVHVDTISVTGFTYYHALGEIGDVYSFKVLTTPGMLTVNCPQNNILYDTVKTGINVTKYFGFGCAPSTNFDLQVHQASSIGITSQQLCIQNVNTYCTPTNSTLTVHFSPKYVFGSSIPAPTSVSGNTAIWNLGALSYLNSPMNINVNLVVPGVPLIAGDTVHTTCIISPGTGDANPVNNMIVQTDTVKASYDPNDIAVKPGFCIPSFSATRLRYKIRFENVGNAPANNIYIMDTLSDQLNPETLSLISATHNVTISHWYHDVYHHIYKFEFININLPDSSYHNECQGAVIFEIDTKAGLPDYTLIPNRAGIYFDENSVVLTNTVNNLTGCPVSVTNIDNDRNIDIYPNPANNEINISAPKPIGQISIINTLGQKISNMQYNGKTARINIKELPAGVYYLEVDNVLVEKFVKE